MPWQMDKVMQDCALVPPRWVAGTEGQAAGGGSCPRLSLGCSPQPTHWDMAAQGCQQLPWQSQAPNVSKAQSQISFRAQARVLQDKGIPSSSSHRHDSHCDWKSKCLPGPLQRKHQYLGQQSRSQPRKSSSKHHQQKQGLWSSGWRRGLWREQAGDSPG